MTTRFTADYLQEPAEGESFYIKRQAESYDSQSGTSTFGWSGEGGFIGDIENNDWLAYSVDLGDVGVDTFYFRVGTPKTGTIQIRLGSTTGTLIGSASIPSNGAWGGGGNWVVQGPYEVTPTTGAQTIYLVFQDGSYSWLDFDYWEATGTSPGLIKNGINFYRWDGTDENIVEAVNVIVSGTETEAAEYERYTT